MLGLASGEVILQRIEFDKIDFGKCELSNLCLDAFTIKAIFMSCEKS